MSKFTDSLDELPVGKYFYTPRYGLFYVGVNTLLADADNGELVIYATKAPDMRVRLGFDDARQLADEGVYIPSQTVRNHPERYAPTLAQIVSSNASQTAAV